MHFWEGREVFGKATLTTLSHCHNWEKLALVRVMGVLKHLYVCVRMCVPAGARRMQAGAGAREAEEVLSRVGVFLLFTPLPLRGKAIYINVLGWEGLPSQAVTSLPTIIEGGASWK